MKKKEDLRIRKTKASLYKTLLQLMEEKQFEEIKVTDICKLSMINRSTFYDHFNDKYELLTYMINDLKEDLTTHLNVDCDVKSIKEYCIEFTKLLLDYQNKNSSIFSTISILKKNNNSIAYDMLKETALFCATNYLKDNYINESDIPMELISKLYISGLINICLENTNNKYSEEILSKYLDKLIPNLDFLKLKS